MDKQQYSTAADSGFKEQDNESQPVLQLHHPGAASVNVVSDTVLAYREEAVQNGIIHQETASGSCGGAELTTVGTKPSCETSTDTPTLLAVPMKPRVTSTTDVPTSEFTQNDLGPSFHVPSDPLIEAVSPGVEGLSMVAPESPPSQPNSWQIDSNSEQEIRHPSEEERRSDAVDEMVVVQEISVEGMKSKLAENEATIRKLRGSLDQVKQEKQAVQQKLAETVQEYDKIVAEKSTEIDKLKQEVDEYKESKANLEKTNEEDRVKYEEKIRNLEKRLENKEKEHSDEKFKLMEEISQSKIQIAQMETREERLKRQLANKETEEGRLKLQLANKKTEEEKLKRQLAEANLELEKERKLTLEAENSAVKKERDAAQEKIEKQNSTIQEQASTIERQNSDLSDLSKRKCSACSVSSSEPS